MENQEGFNGYFPDGPWSNILDLKSDFESFVYIQRCIDDINELVESNRTSTGRPFRRLTLETVQLMFVKSTREKRYADEDDDNEFEKIMIQTDFVIRIEDWAVNKGLTPNKERDLRELSDILFELLDEKFDVINDNIDILFEPYTIRNSRVNLRRRYGIREANENFPYFPV